MTLSPLFETSSLWNTHTARDPLPEISIQDPSLPLVSVITPSYNQGKFIRETIESVLQQDYPNLEYWVMDGGSTDETVSILKEYEHDPRFHWISEPDRGQSDAINKGWSRCRGKILAWLNSDDTYLPGAIRTQVSALEKHADCGAVYGDGVFIDQDGKHIYTCYGAPYNIIEFLRITLPLQPTVFIRREICEQIGMLDANFGFSMDTEYWVRAAKITKFWYEPCPVATYRLHNQSKTIAGYRGFYKDWFSIADSFFSDVERSAPYQNEKNQVYAGIYSRMAAMEAESGSLKDTLTYLFKSISLGGLRLRNFKTALVLLDRLSPVKITTRSIQLWTYLRSRLLNPVSLQSNS